MSHHFDPHLGEPTHAVATIDHHNDSAEQRKHWFECQSDDAEDAAKEFASQTLQTEEDGEYVVLELSTGSLTYVGVSAEIEVSYFAHEMDPPEGATEDTTVELAES